MSRAMSSATPPDPRVDLHSHQAVVQNKVLDRGTGGRVWRTRRERVPPARQRRHVRDQENQVAVDKPLRWHGATLVVGTRCRRAPRFLEAR